MILPSFLQLNIDIAGEAAKQSLPFSGEGATGIFVGRILTAMMAIAAIIVLIALVTGAVDWINAGGDKSKIEKAREKMTQAVMGIFVLSAVLAIFTLVQSFLGISIFTFTNGGRNSEVNQIGPGNPTRNDVNQGR